MFKALINYADGPDHFTALQNLNNSSAYKTQNFDKIFSFRRGDLGLGFYEKNKHILNDPEGAGWRVWKPYIIHRTLKYLNEGDILFYCDVGAMFIKSIDPVLNKLLDTDGMLICHQNNGKEDTRQVIKRDTFTIMGCDNEKFFTGQILSGYVFVINNEYSRNIIREWLYYCQDRRAISNDPNELGKPNYPQFKYHRHDQSILNLLTIKYNVPTTTDMTQYGNLHRDSEDGYGQLMHHFGGPNEGLINDINIDDFR